MKKLMSNKKRTKVGFSYSKFWCSAIFFFALEEICHDLLAGAGYDVGRGPD
jgi:hypothetical protein